MQDTEQESDFSESPLGEPQSKEPANLGSSINDLPPEVLISVFTLYAAVLAWRPSSRRSWILLMSVCRYWRDVACSAQTLWRDIDVGWNVEWVKLCLSRSVSCPIDVVAYHQEARADTLSALLPHSSRIRTVQLFQLEDSCIEELSLLLVKDLPLLEKLHITLDVPRPQDSELVYPDFPISAERSPCLLKLNLTRTVVPRDTAIYPQLRYLSLTQCWCTTEELLDVLSTSTALEELRLLFTPRKTRASDPPAHISHSSRRALIALPNLTRLEVNDACRWVATLLEHLDLPRLEAADICGAFSSLAELAEGPMHSTLPSDTTKCLNPLLSQIKNVRLSVYSDIYSIEASTALILKDVPSLRLCMVDAPPDPRVRRRANWYNCISRALTLDFIPLLRGVPLTRITFLCDYDGIDVQVWQKVLIEFPALETIQLSGRGIMTTWWTALRTLSEAKHPQDNMPEYPPLPCASLRSIDLGASVTGSYAGQGSSTEADDGLFEEIIKCLRVRAVRGSRLEALHLTFRHYEYDDYYEMYREYIPQIEELAECVTYTDIVDEVM